MVEEIEISKISELSNEELQGYKESLQAKSHDAQNEIRLMQYENKTKEGHYKILCIENGLYAHKLALVNKELKTRGLISDKTNRGLTDIIADIIKENLSKESYNRIIAEAERRKNKQPGKRCYLYSEEDDYKIQNYSRIVERCDKAESIIFNMKSHLELIRKEATKEGDFFKSEFMMNLYKELKSNF